MTVLKKGARGELVAALQWILGANKENADGKFGAKTYKALVGYQKANGLTADGVAGGTTWAVILADVPVLRIGDTGKYVRALEVLLNLTPDGTYADAEAARVRTYQAAQGLAVDGVAGKDTWRALLGLTDTAATTPTTTVNVRPVDYKQYDSRWRSKMYSSRGDKSQTMKSSGCGPTAAADVVATMCDARATPWDMAQLYMQKGFRTANSGTAWGAFKWTFQQYSEFSKFVQTSSHATALAALGQGALIVASVGPGYWTKGGHFICLWKCDGTYMYACDPASGTRKKQKLTAFKDQVKQYFVFWQAK